ncbi:oligopeptide transport ATP-binding protein OppF [Photobacterium aphoticum]|uniref:Oligopeptide transport ATP-binding protein OppF n=1 Tax=Photobacterium aphoticum TaxID=754436 RepID=A0A090QWM8_9GAMM|nr:oligopeptide transport ATP-binding protein OppF [Photobacterium aphoticum]
MSTKAMRPLRKDMQIVFQDPMESLNQRHTIGMILEEPFIIHKIGTPQERQTWVKELLVKVGLPETAVNRYPHEFSGGQRQRIGIARAIALKPKLLICDESVSALDVSVQAQILNLLLQLQKEMNLAIIFISHDLSVVKHISDNVVVMYFGKVVEMGPAKEIYANPQAEYTKKLLSAIPITHPKDRKRKRRAEKSSHVA